MTFLSVFGFTALVVFTVEPVRAGSVRVAVVQMEAKDGDVVGNLSKVDAHVATAKEAGAQIVVLPELVDAGFGPIVGAKSGGAEAAHPIPGSTSDALGTIAKKYGVWIVAAILETVPGGAYDALVVLDSSGSIVLRQRKAFVYPLFGGVPTFAGDFHDMASVESPWGRIGALNCAEAYSPSNHALLASKDPCLVLITFANPPADLPAQASAIAKKAGAPAVGANLIFPREPRNRGGKSIFVDAAGTVLWQASTDEVVKVLDVTLPAPSATRPRVDAGATQTVRVPTMGVDLVGRVLSESPATLEWSKVRGPGTVTFETIDSAATHAVFSSPGVYELRLTATAEGRSGSSTVTVTVLPAEGDPNLVGSWSFEGDATDASGKENHGTLSGSALFAADPAPGGGRQSLLLDGKGHVSVPHDASLDAPHSVTIAAWVKPRVSFRGFIGNGRNEWAALVNKGNTWGAENYGLAFGAYYYVFGLGNGFRVPSLDDCVLTPGTWIHVAMVQEVDAGRGVIFINGVRDHSVVSVPESRVNPNPLHLGVFRPGALGIDGKLDEVRLWRRPLADAEVAALVEGAAVNKPPTVNAGPDVGGAQGVDLALAGSITDDAHPATSATARWTWWEKVSGPGMVTFADCFAPATTVRGSINGTYVLALHAFDGGHHVWDTVTVSLRNNSAD
jgi:predicted amidohydrolase